MLTRQCKGCQMGQSSGVLLKEMATLRRCSTTEVFLYTYVHTSACNSKHTRAHPHSLANARYLARTHTHSWLVDCHQERK